ncbi:MAG: peptidase C69 [Dehalococcoidia bacterium]|nr:peptidase C69 [Dehalococcoidia bacterium]
MKEVVERALNVAELRGAQFADVRVVLRRTRSVTVKNRQVEAVAIQSSSGFGVRALVDGSWGFASAATLTREKAAETAALACTIARASGRVQAERARLAETPVVRETYRTPVERNPFAISLDDKIALLLRASQAMEGESAVKVAEASAEAWEEHKLYGNSEGSLIEQTIVQSGAGIEATAVAEDEVQKRSYPNSFGRQAGTAGWELVEEMDLVGNAPRIAAEAAQLLDAAPCPGGTRTIILDPTQVALQVHESCGHPSELDRVLGTEASFAGTSFLTPEKLGTYRYGSELVNITADATALGGLGTFGYDDEGVAAQRAPLVVEGRFVGYLTSRDTAATLGRASNGTARADGWNRIPLIRMTNINLEPGDWALADLIADTDDGIYMQTNKSWSIDDRRLNFQFGTEIAWEIKGGQLGRPFKNATYTGITPEFWGACDAVCKEWQLWGTPNCGKGQPMQVARVGHGTAAARFRDVRVGVMSG